MKLIKEGIHRGYSYVITIITTETAKDLTDAQAFVTVNGPIDEPFENSVDWEALLTSNDASQIGWNMICLEKDAAVYINNQLDKDLTLVERLEQKGFVKQTSQEDEKL